MIKSLVIFLPSFVPRVRDFGFLVRWDVDFFWLVDWVPVIIGVLRNRLLAALFGCFRTGFDVGFIIRDSGCS